MSKGDWPKDFEHENGGYFNKCWSCKWKFQSHKDRHICKTCYDKEIERKSHLTEEQKEAELAEAMERAKGFFRDMKRR